MVNEERVARGLVLLADSAVLAGAAAHHSQDMVAADYFDHESPTGETLAARVLASGYVSGHLGYRLGENIALAPSDAANAAAVVTAWMNDAGHRAKCSTAATGRPGWR